MSELVAATLQSNTEEESIKRLEKIDIRRQNLESEQKHALSALNSFQKTREETDQINKFNDSIEILRELKEDFTEKFREVSENLESIIEDDKDVTQAKVGVEYLNLKMKDIENHLKIVETNGSILNSFNGTGQLNENISLSKQWINFFVRKIMDAEKRVAMISQYETMYENLKFMRACGEEDEAGMEEMVKQFKLQISMIKPSTWEQKHVENLRISINNFSEDVDEIGFINANLDDALQQLTSSTFKVLKLE
ncbi:hypothetical protein GCK72_008098 [Caenorhabditis remanei]|uniref:Uncharacterized protein n=1 Tax=Caenorhabditis remanei TaxID=31234 RepID=A0A6A5HNA3_CAERE|nr:hypothetical protein GCK72_008098 [Caenorhabditis remanei]KAF1768136.1 hypothetical protein GCK72_008098 [Caenorhabditis remanei]